MKKINDMELDKVTGGEAVIRETDTSNIQNEQKKEETATTQNDKWHRPLISVSTDFKK
jgi:hypothetical protein